MPVSARVVVVGCLLVVMTGCAATRARHAAAREAQPTAVAAAAAAAGGRPAAPEPASPITDQFALRAGYYLGTASTAGRVDDTASNSTGTPFALEDDFHASPHAHQARVEMMFRMRERSRLRVDMWELNRDATAAPPRNIVFGANTFTPADTVKSSFDWRQVDFTYTYSIVQSRRVELGLGLGVHLLQAEAVADVAAGAGRLTPVHEDFSGAGPFATLALDGSWRVTRRFAFSARGQYLRLHISSSTAALSDYHADVQFRWRPNLAVGLGYQSTQTRLEVKNSANNGYVRLDLRGPELFLRASF